MNKIILFSIAIIFCVKSNAMNEFWCVDKSENQTFFETFKNATVTYKVPAVKKLIFDFKKNESSLTANQMNALIETSREEYKKAHELKLKTFNEIKESFPLLLQTGESISKQTVNMHDCSITSPYELIFNTVSILGFSKLLQQYQELEEKSTNLLAIQLLFETNFMKQ